MTKRGSRSKDASDILEWLAKTLFWFLFVPSLGALAYYTGTRPYISSNLGLYASGFTDGGILISTIIILAIWLLSKLGLYPSKAERSRKIRRRNE